MLRLSYDERWSTVYSLYIRLCGPHRLQRDVPCRFLNLQNHLSFNGFWMASSPATYINSSTYCLHVKYYNMRGLRIPLKLYTINSRAYFVLTFVTPLWSTRTWGVRILYDQCIHIRFVPKFNFFFLQKILPKYKSIAT